MHPIRLRGARTHNLKGVSLDLHPGELACLTGPSGAGKSSLAMDTLYAEGQRRFVESFSPYARQFLERLERPPIDSLDPVAATVAVDRRAPIKSSRSTLATMADLEPYLAAMFSKESLPVCGKCGVLARETTAADATEALLSAATGADKATIVYDLSPKSGEHFLELRETLAKDGYRRLLIGGELRDLDVVPPSEALAAGASVVVDRVTMKRSDARRLQQAIETAWERGHGRATIITGAAGSTDVAKGLVCPSCAASFHPARAGLFSYNSPIGACPQCKGFGRIIAVDWDKVIPDPSKSIAKGAIKAWGGSSAEWERGVLVKFCAKNKIPADAPWKALTVAQREAVLEGEGSWKAGKYPGVRAWFKWLETRTYKMHVRVFLARYREYLVCGACKGSRLNDTARTYRVADLDVGAWHGLTVTEASGTLRTVAPKDAQGKLAHAELVARLGYLDKVGLGYLRLDRQARTLSGGEAQRAGLTTALSANLTGALFVLDEPTVGLHATDVPKLAGAMRDLASAGNSVLVIEHDRGVVEACDRVIELGPGAGSLGGNVLFDGTPAALGRTSHPTALAWARQSDAQKTPRKSKTSLLVRGACEHNLKSVDVDVPLGVVCAVTGPSGSGKSTLSRDIIYRGVARALGDTSVDKPGAYASLSGTSTLRRAVLVDQSPLGRTARGNAATYTKAWDRIRARFAGESSAVSRGLAASHFSFNVAGAGRCEACSGEGYETIEMQFLADVSLLCAVCQGKRFKPEVLTVKHRDRSVADVLNMTIEEALAVFDASDDDDPVFRRALSPCVRVGLGYLPLGQPLSTLSGGEAQRLKLARALSEEAAGTLFVLDEPSAGLHASDTRHVIAAMHELTSAGASVLVVEHDLDVIRASDWVIDLGPDAGPHGGEIVAIGTPASVSKQKTRTGLALRAHTAGSKIQPPRARSTDQSQPAIRVERAREHNLKDITCSIPHGSLCVVTGPSGSGKSSLAFDVIFAEGQRRFMETLTPYARQFLPTLPRPDVDRITGVPPSIALEQRTTRAGANSTVATVTEAAHYLRLLFAKLGEMHCPKCDGVVEAISPDELFLRLTSSKSDARSTVYSPAVRARKGTYLDLLTSAARAGIVSARVDGAIIGIDPPPRLAKSKEHTIDLIVHYGRLADLQREVFDRAIAWGGGGLRVSDGAPSAKASPKERVLSTARACPQCGTGVPELDPRWFSFNTKQGACEACEGTGVRGGPSGIELGETRACDECDGARLSAVPRRVRLFGETYASVTRRDVTHVLALASAWKFTGKAALIAEAPHAELLRRLRFAVDVGLGYLALDRAASTLSGGEMQRLRLSAQLGSGLTGALYVLDEPTIGLHPRDTRRLIDNLRALTRSGSTVLVVEHDVDTIRAADHLIDLGPSGGRGGGRIIAEGRADAVLAHPDAPTAQALAMSTRAWRKPLKMPDRFLVLSGAREHNLKDVTLRVPIGRMTVVAGVSGSGKSTLVRRVLYPALRKALGLVSDVPGAHDKLTGHQYVKRAMAVDQSPIGRSPRSVPATFLGVWDEVRRLFASLPESKIRGYGPARFSFNSAAAGGRCPACEGQGAIVSEMAFLPDVISTCEACRGARFEPATLEVKYANLSAGDVLQLSAEEAAEAFQNHRKISRPLQTLCDLGVGYLQIGQGSHTLSGGEAQRLKLAAELTAKIAHEPTVYVLDEPTTGLHLSDARRLISVLDLLVARGDTLIVIEHHPDVIASADWVVELGPEGGMEGGSIVYEGEARSLAKAKTPTGKFFASAHA